MDIEKDIAVEKDDEKTLKELLKKVKRGNIDVDSVLLQLNDIVKKEELKAILENHHYSIYEGETKSNGKIYKRWFTYVNEGGKKRQIKRKTKEEVEEYLYDFYTNANIDTNTKQSAVMTFKDCYYSWLEFKKMLVSSNTIYRYEYDYKRFLKDTDFENKNVKVITDNDILVYLSDVVKAQNFSEKALKTLIGYIKEILDMAVSDSIIDLNMLYKAKPKLKLIYKKCTRNKDNSADKIISKEDISKLMKRIREDYINKPYEISVYAVEFALLTGCRLGEIVALKWEDVDNGVIRIRRSEKTHREVGKVTYYTIGNTKTCKERQIPLTEPIEDLLKRVADAEDKINAKGEFVFADLNGRMKSTCLSRCLERKCKQVGIARKSVTSIRKTVNSTLKEIGGNTYINAAMLGHTEKVNDNHYTYDITKMDTKKALLENANKVMVS